MCGLQRADFLKEQVAGEDDAVGVDGLEIPALSRGLGLAEEISERRLHFRVIPAGEGRADLRRPVCEGAAGGERHIVRGDERGEEVAELIGQGVVEMMLE